ncbi:MAG: hypothetical protein M1370_10125 [Bacteroidetes bacterium]|nr:hypothetical protein [Bacteroidota bacterium]MCL5024982.1 hypothetical protein [Chloroflexota bacterium]
MRGGIAGLAGQARGVPLPTATAVAVAQEIATQSPTSLPTATSAPTAKPAASPTTAPAVIPSPTRVPPTPSPAPKPPTPTSVPKPTPPVLASAVTQNALGVRLQPPQGWERSESVDGPREGWLSFFAKGGEARTFLLSKLGAFAFQIYPLTTLDTVPSADLLLAFEDSLVSEYATQFGEADLTEGPLEPIENAKNAGWTATARVTGAGGTYEFIWWDISQPGVANTVFCGSSAEMWDQVLPVCRAAFESIELVH